MSSKEWKYIDASSFCAKVADGTHDSPKRQDVGKPLITSKHIKGRSIDFDTAYLISQTDFEKINLRSKVDKWDVLISMIGEYCGYCYVERNENIDYAVKNVGIFKTGSKLKAEWIYYYLNSPEGKNTLASLKSGTSQPYISLGALRGLPILIPTSENEMEKITSILSSLDDKIELNRQTNQTLEAIAQTLFKEICLPKGEELPEGWKVGKLGEVCDITSGKGLKKEQFTEQGFDVLGANGRIGFTNNFLIDDEFILTGRVGTLGTFQLVYERCWISDNVLALKPQNKNSFYFIYFWIKSVDFKNLNRGSTQPLVTKTDLQNLELVCPTDEVLNLFNALSRPIFEQIQANKKENQTLTTLRDSLLPKLMKGEIDLDISNG